MNVKNKLRKLAKDFNLDYGRGEYKYLIFPKEDLILSNFVCACHDTHFQKEYYHSAKKGIKHISKFKSSKKYREELKRPQGRVIHNNEIKIEIQLVNKIGDKELKRKLVGFYNRIKSKISKNGRLPLIYKTNKETRIQNEILLHEWIHELLESNRIRAENINWNEGLVMYLTEFSLGRHRRLEEKIRKKGSKVWNIYAPRWAKLLKDVDVPELRRKIILKKINK